MSKNVLLLPTLCGKIYLTLPFKWPVSYFHRMLRTFGMFQAHKFLFKAAAYKFANVPSRSFAIFASPKQVKSVTSSKYFFGNSFSKVIVFSRKINLFSNNNPKFETYRSFRKMPVINHNMAACGDGILESSHSDVFLFTSESVGEGHPDKMCDQVIIISSPFYHLCNVHSTPNAQHQKASLPELLSLPVKMPV